MIATCGMQINAINQIQTAHQIGLDETTFFTIHNGEHATKKLTKKRTSDDARLS